MSSRNRLLTDITFCLVVTLRRLSEKSRVTWSWLRRPCPILNATRRSWSRRSNARTRRSPLWQPSLKMNSLWLRSCKNKSRNCRWAFTVIEWTQFGCVVTVHGVWFYIRFINILFVADRLFYLTTVFVSSHRDFAACAGAVMSLVREGDKRLDGKWQLKDFR